ncbi:hypothetical protein BGAL_0496g00090 [Botrytis galanthina]|uniref:Uncharacterized protein n=1 Tax=Botrytis galanthina TaxID=278940 RepID=A0A4S8QQ93_9HELO|nr:hypothetical protein BGAL_0496g00090 [Botrytis galanthina]
MKGWYRGMEKSPGSERTSRAVGFTYLSIGNYFDVKSLWGSVIVEDPRSLHNMAIFAPAPST